MEKRQIIDKINKRIKEDILKDISIEVQDNDSLITSGLIDSFSLVDLALIVEDLFSVRIEDHELNSESFDTLNELAEIILSRLPSI